MTTRKIILTAAALSVLAPALCNASSEKASARACANAFATNMAAPAAARAYKLAYRGGTNDSFLNFYAVTYSFTLEARDPSTGTAFARARCSTDSHATVTEFTALPLESKNSTMASAF